MMDARCRMFARCLVPIALIVASGNVAASNAAAPPDTFALSDVTIRIAATPSAPWSDRYELRISDWRGRFVGCREGRWRRARFNLYSAQLSRIVSLFYANCFFDLLESYHGIERITVAVDGTARAGTTVRVPGETTEITLTIGSYSKTITLVGGKPPFLEDLVAEVLQDCESSQWFEVDPDPVRAPPAIRPWRRTPDGGVSTVVSNPGSKTFWYTERGGSPQYVAQVLSDGDWRRAPIARFFCGVGVRYKALAPGDSVILTVPSGDLPDGDDPVRIGVSFLPTLYEECFTVWSGTLSGGDY